MLRLSLALLRHLKSSIPLVCTTCVYPARQGPYQASHTTHVILYRSLYRRHWRSSGWHQQPSACVTQGQLCAEVCRQPPGIHYIAVQVSSFWTITAILGRKRSNAKLILGCVDDYLSPCLNPARSLCRLSCSLVQQRAKHCTIYGLLFILNHSFHCTGETAEPKEVLSEWNVVCIRTSGNKLCVRLSMHAWKY